jgi:hypothetical protein
VCLPVCAQNALARNEAEMGRLGMQSETDASAAALAARNNANESMILQLNSTVSIWVLCAWRLSL